MHVQFSIVLTSKNRKKHALNLTVIITPLWVLCTTVTALVRPLSRYLDDKNKLNFRLIFSLKTPNRISRTLVISIFFLVPADFEITRVDCISHLYVHARGIWLPALRNLSKSPLWNAILCQKNWKQCCVNIFLKNIDKRHPRRVIYY